MNMLRQKKGLTLIEIIIALAILGIIMVAFLSGFGSGFASIFTMGNKTKAVAEAQTIVDFIYNEGTINDSQLMSTFDIEGKVSHADLESSPYNSDKPIYYSVTSQTIGSVTVDRVTVLVFYHGGSRYVTLSALIP